MDGRTLAGLIVSMVGMGLFSVGAAIGDGAIYVLGIYGLIFIAIGIVIFLNKKEDKIEEPNYSKVKGGLKYGK